MIKYALACDSGHAFESWFPSGAAYDEQVARGLVACPFCGSGRVEKQIMAPSVARTDREPASPPPASASPAGGAPASLPAPASAGALPPAPLPAAPEPVALVGERERALRAALAELRAHVVANSEDVGRRFAEEARRIHAGDAPERAIMGEATPDEVGELLDEGVPIAPLPILPDERN